MLHIALALGNTLGVQKVLNHALDPHGELIVTTSCLGMALLFSRNETALHLATKRRNGTLIRFLLDKSVDVRTGR